MGQKEIHPVFKLRSGVRRIAWYPPLTLVAFFLIFGCISPVAVSEPISTPASSVKLLALPFKNMSLIYGENVNVRSLLSGKVFLTGEVIDSAEDILIECLISRLKTRTDFHLIQTAQDQGIISGLLDNNQNPLSDRQVAVKTAKALSADAVMIGHVYRFKQRIGTRYAIESPASVAFDIYLINVKNNGILWSGYFDETQRSLSENLFQLGTFLKRKGSWITAEEMARSGLEEIFRTIP